jgi:hypothetical protein
MYELRAQTIVPFPSDADCGYSGLNTNHWQCRQYGATTRTKNEMLPEEIPVPGEPFEDNV